MFSGNVNPQIKLIEIAMNTKKIPIWLTRDGQSIPITQVTESHLNNAINHLKRSVIENKEYWINYCKKRISEENEMWLEMELDDRMRGANYFTGREYIPTEDTEEIKKYQKLIKLIEDGDPKRIDIYEELIAEKERRGTLKLRENC